MKTEEKLKEEIRYSKDDLGTFKTILSNAKTNYQAMQLKETIRGIEIKIEVLEWVIV